MKNRLKAMFEYHKFFKSNDRLQAVIDETEDIGIKELDQDELEFINAAGQNFDNFEEQDEEDNGYKK